MDTNAAQRDQREGSTADLDRYRKMCELGVEEKIKEFPYFGVSKEHLELISCVQLDNIDVDNIDARHGNANATTFFEPSGPIHDGLKDILSQDWYELGPGAAPRIYPDHRATWFTNPWVEADLLESDDLHIDRFGGTAWICMSYVWKPTSFRLLFTSCELALTYTASSDRWEVKETAVLMLPCGVADKASRNVYFSDFAFLTKDESKPHLACIIMETFASPDKMLRSELHGAVALVKYQLATWDNKPCGDRPIKPVSSPRQQLPAPLASRPASYLDQADMFQVMLYTFQSDQYARITQAYFDRGMGKIVLRQSRQFDLRGPKPTDDAWLLLRWMLNTPVGDTVAKEELSLPIRVKESPVGPAKSSRITVTSPSGNTRGI